MERNRKMAAKERKEHGKSPLPSDGLGLLCIAMAAGRHRTTPLVQQRTSSSPAPVLASSVFGVIVGSSCPFSPARFLVVPAVAFAKQLFTPWPQMFCWINPAPFETIQLCLLQCSSAPNSNHCMNNHLTKNRSRIMALSISFVILYIRADKRERYV
jgi:hypothetical protein